VLSSTPTDAQRILDAYDASLLDASSIVTAEEREIVEAAQNYLAMYEAVRIGIQVGNDETIRQSYNGALAQRFSGITPTEQLHIDQAMLLHQLENILAKNSMSRVSSWRRPFKEQTARRSVAPSL